MADVQSILDPLQIPKGVKANAYDAYQSATSADDLQKQLDKLPLPTKVKADLWDAKNAETPAPAAQSGQGTDTWDPRTWSLEHNPVSNTLAGIGSGAISTGVGAYNLARKVVPGAAQVLPAPNADVQAATQAPAGFFGGAGKFAEQAAEFALPMGGVAKAVEAAPLAVRLATEAATAGGIAGVQTGGDVPAMAETAATTGALGGIGAAIPASVKAALGKAFAKGVRPLTQGALDLADKYHIPLTQGMRTGSATLQTAEKVLGRTVASGPYEAILNAGQEGAANAAADLSGGFATDNFSAGQNTVNSMLDMAKTHSDTAATEYSNLAAHEADPANTRTVQVGMKANPSLDPNAPATIPDMQPVGLPTDMRPVKTAIAPAIANLERAMTPAQRNIDPGLTALKNIMARPDALPASVAEQDLGYLKDIQRSDASAQSKRLATIAVNALQPAIDSGVSVGGQDALDSLQNARGSWAARSSILDNVKTYTGDATGRTGQVRLMTTLLAPADASYPALEQVLNATPQAADDIGKAFLTDRVFKTAADGGNLNPVSAQRLWNQIGPRTKAAIYTPETIQNINDGLELFKRIAENPNPSGTGPFNALLHMGLLVTTHPVGGAANIALGRNIAKILYNPAAAATARQALDNLNSPLAGKYMLAIKSMMNSGETALAGDGTPAQ